MFDIMYPSQRQRGLTHPARPADDDHPMTAVFQQAAELVRLLAPVDKPLRGRSQLPRYWHLDHSRRMDVHTTLDGPGLHNSPSDNSGYTIQPSSVILRGSIRHTHPPPPARLDPDSKVTNQLRVVTMSTMTNLLGLRCGMIKTGSRATLRTLGARPRRHRWARELFVDSRMPILAFSSQRTYLVRKKVMRSHANFTS
jgi:hypothetical protein